jgi:soluble lytic murein transglycosylase
MKVFAHTLFAVSVLVFGFLLGVRYEARVQSLNEIDTLVRVQKEKIAALRDQNLELRTVVLLREFLDEERIRLPREAVNGMAVSIARASERYSLSPDTILAVIRTESAFDVNALSDKGAVGLMQILPSTAQEIAQELRMEWRGDDLLRDPSANIEMGAYYLTKLIGQFNNLAVALTAYNHGPGRVAELTQAKADLPMGYAEKVLSYTMP